MPSMSDNVPGYVSTRYTGRATADDERQVNRSSKQAQEDRDRRDVFRRHVSIYVLILILFLLLVGGWLFAALYADDETSDMKHQLRREIDRDFASVNATLELDFEQLNATIAALGGVYVGNNVPATTLGNPNSLYIRNGTNTIYYKTSNTSWSLVLNATGAAPVCIYNILPGVTFAGPWNSSLVYLNGTIVIYNNFLYISEVNNTNIVPSMNSTIWSILYSNITGAKGDNGTQGIQGPPGQPLVFEGTWNNVTMYGNGQVVIYNNSLYIGLTNNTNDPPSSDPSAWTLFLVNATGPKGDKGDTGPIGLPGTSLLFDGAWNATTNYTTGDLVSYGNDIYISMIVNNYNNTPGLNVSIWYPVVMNITGLPGMNGVNGTNGTGFVFYGVWSSVPTYPSGSTVFFNGSLYMSNSSSTNDEPDTSPAIWTNIWSPTPGQQGQPGFNGTIGPMGISLNFQGNWSAVTNYTLNSLVIQNGTAFLAITPNQNVMPGTNSSDWAQFSFCIQGNTGQTGANGTAGAGVEFEGFWSGSQPYVQSNIVLYNNSMFIAYNASTGLDPLDNPSRWALVSTCFQGAMGTNGTNGFDGLNGTSVMFFGNWSSVATYPAGGLVYYNGSLFITAMSNTDVVPPANGSVWTMVGGSITGATGDPGNPGTNGTNGSSALFGGYWNATALYSGSTFIISNNSLYVSWVSNTNVLPGSNSSVWALIASNLTGPQGIQGPVGPSGLNATTTVVYDSTWASNITYAVGNFVLFNQSVYVASMPNTGITPSTNASVWDFVFGPVVGQTGNPGTNGTNGLDGISMLFVGTWNTSFTYQQSEIVIYNMQLWIAITNNTNVVPSSDPATWAEVQSIVGTPGTNGTDGTSMAYEGPWSNSTTYLNSNVVVYNNVLYISSGNNTNTQPDTNNSTWTSFCPTINCTAGAQGPNGTQGTSVGANTDRIVIGGTQVSFSTVGIVPYQLVGTGAYNSGPTDPTHGGRWGPNPLFANETSGLVNMKSELTEVYLFRGNTTTENYLRVDVVGTPVGGGVPTTFTICTTGGILFTTANDTIPSVCGSVFWDVFYQFNFVMQPTLTGSNFTCASTQVGTFYLPGQAQLSNIGVPNTFTQQTTTIDLTQYFYFQYTGANFVSSDPSGCCISMGVCTVGYGMGTSTEEYMQGSAN